MNHRDSGSSATIDADIKYREFGDAGLVHGRSPGPPPTHPPSLSLSLSFSLGVTLNRRCAYRPSVIYFIVNKLLSDTRGFHFARRCLSRRGLAPTETVARRSKAERPRKQARPSAGSCVCVLLLRDLLQSCSRGGGRRVEDMCYERRRAEACVGESAHHALVNAGGREIV